VLSVPVLRRALLVIAAAVAACLVAVVAACSGAPGDRAPARPVPMVALDDHLFSLTWEGDSVCLHGAFPTLPACAPVDARSTEAVLSALLQPLDAGADVLVVVTRPAVALDGLGARVVRTLMAPAGGRPPVAVVVAIRAARTAKVCAAVGEGHRRTALVVHRAVAVAAGRPAERAEDGC
jgi:hypothetical protein